METNFIGFSWIIHSNKVHEKQFHRVVDTYESLMFIDLKEFAN